MKRISNEEYSFKLKTPWSDGTTHLILSPTELIEKLAALVPPPRHNFVRDHGVLAPHAKLRAAVVPKKPDDKELEKTRRKSKNRLLWAALLARTFNLQMEVCKYCNGKMRMVNLGSLQLQRPVDKVVILATSRIAIRFVLHDFNLVAAITDYTSIKKSLDGVGLPSEPPIPMPARPPPQEKFDYYYEGA